MSIPHSIISQQLLDKPDVTIYQELYGITFIPVATEQINNFLKVCETFLRRQPDTALTKPAVLYVPQVFLAQPLKPTQVMAINERETRKVAAYCVDVHSQLAAVPIKESRERMGHLPTFLETHNVAATFSDIPYPDICGEWAGKPQEFYVRQSLADRLVALGHMLASAGAQLHFEEAFRPAGVQEAQFKRRVARTRQEHPNWNEDLILSEAKSKTAYTPRFASHKGGAAVDVLLRNAQTGNLLDFGHKYPDGGVLVFPKTPFITHAQWYNRQLLQVAAGLCDLTLYVGEDWHLSYGDNLASLDEHNHSRKGYIAQYGPIKDFDHTTGEITSIYEPDELNRMFDY